LKGDLPIELLGRLLLLTAHVVAPPGLGIIEPCLPSPAKAPPSGPGWLHEIKHDGFAIWRQLRVGGQIRGRTGKEL